MHYLVILKKVVTYCRTPVYIPATAGESPIFGQFLPQQHPLRCQSNSADACGSSLGALSDRKDSYAGGDIVLEKRKNKTQSSLLFQKWNYSPSVNHLTTGSL